MYLKVTPRCVVGLSMKAVAIVSLFNICHIYYIRIRYIFIFIQVLIGEEHIRVVLSYLTGKMIMTIEIQMVWRTS